MAESSDVFLSYSWDDRVFATRLRAALAAEGVSVFDDAASLQPGSDLRAELVDAIRRARAVVILLSENTRDARWVHHEIVTALEGVESRPVIPVLLDDEGRNNLVWPLVANRRAVRRSATSGNATEDGWLREARDAVLAVLAPSQAGRRRRRRRIAAAALAVACLVGMGSAIALYGHSQRAAEPEDEPEDFAVSISLLNGPTRGGGVITGDKLLIQATARDLVAVYRGTDLVLQCPADERCAKLGTGWKAELELIGPTTYRTVYAPKVGPVALSGSIDADLLTLQRLAKITVVPMRVEM